ncbi:DUF6529 family protein [Kitasatospora sp. NPDC002040]|uniref:DUF6529 family protein n=1 Tax=Kitasatospora sp. NPDC002040 TaxID=3154661 RepID=UPI00331C7089
MAAEHCGDHRGGSTIPAHAAHHPDGPRANRRSPLLLITAILLPLAVTLSLYLYGRDHEPDYSRGLFGHIGADANDLKARLGTALLALALVQVLLALAMYRKRPGGSRAPAAVALVHRLVGLVAFLLSLPIAYQCINAYGVQLTTTRTTLHSLAGCLFYGAFTAKVLIVRSRHAPGWALPLAGSTLVTFIAVLWYTAAFWWFNGQTAPGL